MHFDTEICPVTCHLFGALCASQNQLMLSTGDHCSCLWVMGPLEDWREAFMCCHFRALCTSPSPRCPCPDRDTKEALLRAVPTWDSGFVFEDCGSAPRWTGAQLARCNCHATWNVTCSPRLWASLNTWPIPRCQLQSTSPTLFWSLPSSCLHICRRHWVGPPAPTPINDDVLRDTRQPATVHPLVPKNPHPSHVPNAPPPILWAPLARWPWLAAWGSDGFTTCRTFLCHEPI